MKYTLTFYVSIVLSANVNKSGVFKIVYFTAYNQKLYAPAQIIYPVHVDSVWSSGFLIGLEIFTCEIGSGILIV